MFDTAMVYLKKMKTLGRQSNKMNIDQLPQVRYVRLHGTGYSITARGLGPDPSRCDNRRWDMGVVELGSARNSIPYTMHCHQ